MRSLFAATDFVIVQSISVDSRQEGLQYGQTPESFSSYPLVASTPHVAMDSRAESLAAPSTTVGDEKSTGVQTPATLEEAKEQPGTPPGDAAPTPSERNIKGVKWFFIVIGIYLTAFLYGESSSMQPHPDSTSMWLTEVARPGHYHCCRCARSRSRIARPY